MVWILFFFKYNFFPVRTVGGHEIHQMFLLKDLNLSKFWKFWSTWLLAITRKCVSGDVKNSEAAPDMEMWAAIFAVCWRAALPGDHGMLPWVTWALTVCFMLLWDTCWRCIIRFINRIFTHKKPNNGTELKLFHWLKYIYMFIFKIHFRNMLAYKWMYNINAEVV